MSNASLIAKAADTLSERYGSAVHKRVEFRGDQFLTFGKNDIHEVIRWTRDALGFDMLVDLCSVDHFGSDPRFEVVYTLSQSETGVNLTFKVELGDGEAVPTITDLFKAADWHEREAWDLMGIPFEGHPDLRRILMWDGYPYHPLRKDFPVEGLPTELEGVAFTETAPTDGEPFVTSPCAGTATEREPRSIREIRER